VLRETPEPPVLGSTVSQTPGVPATRADALALLGLNADATDPVIRKLVEALRQSWHPDLATTPEDRAAREERIKAINVAADLLLRKPAA
jgi:DnaJ-class molecular chaperone